MQKPIADLLAGKGSGVHLLPLLMQVAPDVPVVFEHTSEQARTHRWAWLVWHEHILLVHIDGAVFCAESVFDLFSYMSEHGEAHVDASEGVGVCARVVRPRTA